jgi:predicted dehydrogenase
MKRRQFLKSTVLAGGGVVALPQATLLSAGAPSDKLNIALIGAHGRATAHYDSIDTQNVVAICDVDEKHLALAAQRFPRAKGYIDWRKCLDHKGIDAVVICTTDHTHAFVANWSLNRNYHIYCEKPLANTVAEARLVRSHWLKKKHKLATQVGTQRHAIENFNRVRELILDGAIGTLEAARAWGNRQLRRDGYLPAQGQPPADLHYDLWLGPAPYHPYNPGYFSGSTGLNCLQWNMFWDFGSGQIGDMGSHTIDLAWNAIDATLPTSARAQGEPFNPEVTPVEMEAHFEHPANDWRPPIEVSWYQGGAMPENPSSWVDLRKIGHGAMFEGNKGILVADFNRRLIIPLGGGADMTYYRRRTKEQLIPPLGHFQMEWVNACKGDLKTSCDFEYSGNVIEMQLLGLAAYRAGKKLEYDGKSGHVTNVPEANQFLSREYREGWTLDG